MIELLTRVALFMLIPIASSGLAGLIATVRTPAARTRALLQHCAAGILDELI